jgi:hypothetical protein
LRTPNFIELAADISLLYKYTLYGERPGSLVINTRTSLDWSKPVYIILTKELGRADPYDFEHLTSVLVEPSEILCRPIPGYIGLNLPSIRTRISGIDTDQLMVKIEHLHPGIQRDIAFNF